MPSPFRLLLLFICLCTAGTALPQNGPAGSWQGLLEVPGAKLNLVIHILPQGDAYTATFDSPDQGAFGIPFAEAEVEGNKVRCAAPAMGVVFEASVEGQAMRGQWKQGGGAFPLELQRKAGGTTANHRPQLPQKPYPYQEREVEIKVNDEVTLSGTLTLPQSPGPHPATVLVSGSGPQNRDSELLGHKPFLVLADHLTRQGIAVLRYDDRGFAASTGNFATATSAHLADDAEAAFRFLRQQPSIDPAMCGIAGHSEGGLIAPMVAARNPDVAFVIMLAGPAIRGRELLLAQTAALLQSTGAPQDQIDETVALNTQFYDYMLAQPDAATAAAGVDAFAEALLSQNGNQPAGLGKEELQQVTDALKSPWTYYFIHHDPGANLSQLRIPVLALYGGKDVQVPAQPNSQALEAIFAESGIPHHIQTFPHSNHLFQTAETGAFSEYAQIQETMAPEVMQTIATWIRNLSRQ